MWEAGVEGAKARVVMLPWLAHGHTSPFLELAKNLTERNFDVYFCSTPVILNSIKPMINQIADSLPIQLVELHLPLLPDLPHHYHTTNGLPPHLMGTLKKAFDLSSPSFSVILKNLSPDLLIYDFLQPWAPLIARSQNIPAVEFLSTGAAMTAFVLHRYENPGKEFPFPMICLRDHEVSNFDRLLQSSANDMNDEFRTMECYNLSSSIILIKSCRDMEGKYIDYLSSITAGRKIVPVGPLVRDAAGEEDKHGALEWLNGKERNSTVFVSFGSEYFPSVEEMEEIAHGLEDSEMNFIWIIRFPLGEASASIPKALPNGFLQRVSDRGMVVERWGPQARILAHPSVAGFITHCGWSSVMESVRFGVPIIAMPMHLDQPFNSRLVTELGVGVEVKRDKNDKINRKEVSWAIKEVMKREDVRINVQELSIKMRNREGKEMDQVAEQLMLLCKNKHKIT